MLRIEPIHFDGCIDTEAENISCDLIKRYGKITLSHVSLILTESLRGVLK